MNSRSESNFSAIFLARLARKTNCGKYSPLKFSVNWRYWRANFDNVGWVRGTRPSGVEWGAYLWTAQNRIAFRPSATNWWRASSGGVLVEIKNVIVGSLGIYPPLAYVVDIGPHLDQATNNYPGAGLSESREFYADITNVFYEVIIPEIWLRPKQAFACVGGSNVQFLVTGTKIPQGVGWRIYPTNFAGHAWFAVTTTNSAWVSPGTVATNYIIRATSKDNTNFYDEVDLTVVKVDIESLKFNSDHGLLRDNITDFEDTGIVYPEPEWEPSRTNYPNAPISHTMGTNVNVTLSVNVVPSGVSLPYTLSGDGPGTYLDFTASGVLTGGVNAITMSSTGNISTAISKDAGGPITWTLALTGVCTIMTNTGPHKMYVTAGTPYGSDITEKRMEWVTTICDTKTSAHESATEVHDVTPAYALGSPPPNPIWLIAGGSPAECHRLSMFYKACVEMLGWPSGSVVYLYPLPNFGAKEEDNGAARYVRADGIPLGFEDGATPPGQNIFEGAFKYAIDGVTKYYAGGAEIYSTPFECMQYIITRTYWKEDINPVDGVWDTEQVWP